MNDSVLSGGLGDAEYTELQAQVMALNLYERTYWHYGWSAVVAILGIAGSLYAVTVTDNIFFQIGNAIVFAFFSVQICMIGHDLSHGGVFKSTKLNRFFASVVWGLFGGLSEARWFDKHNLHHRNPNHIGHDPDIVHPFMFTAEQLEVKSAFVRTWILPYQHILFWPALAFVYPMYLVLGVLHYFENPSLRLFFEIVLSCTHFFILFLITFIFLPLPAAVIFLVTVCAAIGIYMGAVFAPNHKGRLELRKEETCTWVHQILSSRGINYSWITWYLFGGLNFQIEHHLFPSMPRKRYRKAQEVVKSYCTKKGIPYHETSWLKSLREMHRALKTQSTLVRPLR